MVGWPAMFRNLSWSCTCSHWPLAQDALTSGVFLVSSAAAFSYELELLYLVMRSLEH